MPMNRSHFIKTLILTTMGATMSLGALNKLSQSKSTPPMPVLFVGHGNPMNAIEENSFVESWRNISKTIPKRTRFVFQVCRMQTSIVQLTGSTIHPLRV